MDLFNTRAARLCVAVTLLCETAYAAPMPSAAELGVIMASQATPQPRGAEASRAKPGLDAAAIAPPAPVRAVGSGCPQEESLFLPSAFSFPALLPDAVYSFATVAPVMATLEDDVRFRDRLVLPRGTRLMGNASAIHTLDRVNINWSRVILPEGCEFPISAIALSAEDGAAGIKGKLEKHEAGVAAHIALRSMLTAAGGAAAAGPVGSLESALAGNFSNEVGQNLDESLRQVKSLESIYIHERTAIRVFILNRFVRPLEGR